MNNFTPPPFPLKKITVLVSGTSAILAGTAMLVLPGPGLATILLGLAILGTEFAWAKRLFDRITEALIAMLHKAQELYKKGKERWKK